MGAFQFRGIKESYGMVAGAERTLLGAEGHMERPAAGGVGLVAEGEVLLRCRHSGSLSDRRGVHRLRKSSGETGTTKKNQRLI